MPGQVFIQQPARTIQRGVPQQQQRTARQDVYLPPMPEMLRPKQASAQGAQPKASEYVIRGQSSDEPKPQAKLAKIAIPSAEELGLLPGQAKGEAAASPVAWQEARARLEALKAAYYRLEKADLGFRFSCAIPYAANPTQQRQFEVIAATEEEAMGRVLAQVEKWRTTQQ